MMRFFTFVAGCALLVAPVAGRVAVDFERARQEAAHELALELLLLAEWCQESKLFGSRVACLDEVLLLEPDNETARGELGHKRQKDGSWREPERRRELRDMAPEALPTFRERHAAAASEYGATVLAAMERAEPPLAPARRAEVRAEILALAPDDADLRAAFGEARMGEEWVLVETVAAKARRAELKDIVRASYESAGAAAETAPLERELALGLEWTAVLEVPGVRVLGTVPREELETVARALQASRAAFNGIFGTEVDYYEGATVFVLGVKGDKERFLAAHPALDETERAFLAKLECSGIDGTSDMAHWNKDPRQRLDGIVRITMGWLFYQAFGLRPEVGWAWEGFGLYLTRELLGTRLTWFVKSSEYLAPNAELALRRRLMNDETNWMNEADLVLQGEHPPRLNFVMGKTVNNMTPEDMLCSYVAAAYLLEGRHADAPRLLKRIGEPVGSPQAVADVLGMDVMELDARVRRWLTERR